MFKCVSSAHAAADNTAVDCSHLSPHPQFRALADQLYYSQARHAEVRQAVVDQLCCFPERYRDFVVNTDYKEYVR